MYLSKEKFSGVIALTPLVSIDLLVKNSEGKFLLGYRNNKPAQGNWFVPGGRILKNESMDQAFQRLCNEELGIDCCRNQAQFLGPYEHFYSDCVFSDDITTHYVVLGYQIKLNHSLSQLPSEQHDLYRWFTKEEMLTNKDVHVHSRWYVEQRQDLKLDAKIVNTRIIL